jgi:hypothetical protein
MTRKRHDSELARLAPRAAMFALLVIVLDFLAGHGLAWMYANQKRGNLQRIIYGLEESRAELMIFGSSSANHHFVPEIIGAGLQMSVYNQGRDSMEILYDTAILRGILRRHSPRVAILNLTPSELSAVDSYDKLSVLLPFYRQHPEMRPIIRLRSGFEPWKMLSRVYPYNSTFLALFAGLGGKRNVRPQTGYVPLFRTTTAAKEDWKTFKEEPVLDANRVGALESFIVSCRNNKVALFVVFSPWLHARTDTTATIAAATRLCGRYRVPVFNHILDPEFLGRTELFADEGHLNHQGAEKFSGIMVRRISSHLEKTVPTAPAV